MATLVLTAAGSVLGGPVGGALGAMLGNAIDHRLLGRTRTGPRLTELQVQTSSYGTPIPAVFGTMRVAGTVIWSTDIREAQGRSGGGKGQPATATYSYSASFAVLLSARPIAGIGRIWADGQLVRGAAGDLKLRAGLRVHRGGEDQPVDPLIASAEGAAAPAYRGMAYLVWEDLPLATFGNRLPQLTVEVIADPAPVPAGRIAAQVAPEVRGGDGLAVLGFAATGSVRGVLETLAQAGGGWWAPDGAGLTLRTDADPVTIVADTGEGRARQVAGGAGVPSGIALGHYDPARDWQAGVQRAERPGPATGVARVDMPAALDAAAAKAMAERLLADAQAARVVRTLSPGLAGLAVAPGAIVTVAGEAGRWRVLTAEVEGMVVRLAVSPLPGATVAAGGTSSGRVAAATDRPVGATLLRVVEVPAAGDGLAEAPDIAIVAAGTGAGWRSAALLWSADDGASWTEAGGTAAPGTIGTVEAVSAFATACLFDEAGALVVGLARPDMVLGDADDAALDRGANLAAAGGELIQFGRARSLGAGRWRLTRLLRGRRGTEAAAARAGDGFALLDAPAVRRVTLPMAALGRTVRVMASGAGDIVPVEARIVAEGAALRPPAPVALVREGGGVRWTRRSRAGWLWRDGGDAPLGEEAERYRVTLTAADGATRERDVAAPWIADVAPGTRVSVRQRGTWADSLPAIAIV